MTDYSTSSTSSSSSCSNSSCGCSSGNSNSNSNQTLSGLHRVLGYQEIEGLRFLDNQHVKVTGLSALCTGHLYHA